MFYCTCDKPLEYAYEMAAPGKGTVYKCTACGTNYLVMGRSVQPLDELDPEAFILQPWEVM